VTDVRIPRVVVLPVAFFLLVGCVPVALVGAGASFALLDGAHADRVIGYQSYPQNVPEIGALRVKVYPINAESRRGQEPFVVCVSTWWTGDQKSEIPKTLSIDPNAAFLRLPDETWVRPSGYAVAGRCPYPEYGSLAYEPDFADVVAGSRATAKRVVSWKFQDVALRFPTATVGSSAQFSLDLAFVEVDGQRHSLAPVTFKPVYGRVSPR
jgi:hypothetical protein